MPACTDASVPPRVSSRQCLPSARWPMLLPSAHISGHRVSSACIAIPADPHAAGPNASLHDVCLGVPTSSRPDPPHSSEPPVKSTLPSPKSHHTTLQNTKPLRSPTQTRGVPTQQKSTKSSWTVVWCNGDHPSIEATPPSVLSTGG
jgi:hypothetical protein